MKVCVVITARPSYSRVKTVLENLKGKCDLQIITAASALVERFGNVSAVIEEDGYEITRRVPCLVDGNGPESMALSTSLALQGFTSAFSDLRPDCVVTIADRYETLATAIAASHLNIPLIHLQGGEVTGSIDDKVRYAVSQLADRHFVATENAEARMWIRGYPGRHVVRTGCPSIDLARRHMGSLRFLVFEEYGGVGPTWDFEARDYLIVLQHPVTDEYGRAADQIVETLAAVKQVGMPAFWFWPNPDAGSGAVAQQLRIWREKNPDAKVHFFRSLRPEHFLNLMFNAACIVGNSSVAIREGSYTGTPAVNIGSRQRGRERGSNVIDSNCSRLEIKIGIQQALVMERPMSNLYGDGFSGPRIASLILDGGR